MGRRKTRGVNEEYSSLRSPTTKYLKEDEVLQPVAKNTNPDDWPCFVLNDTVVYDKTGKTPVNLLHAELEGPFIIRGKLEVDKDFRHLLRIPVSNSPAIEIQNARGYSMGIGPVTIWADGSAGWFEIRSAASYQRIYDKMSEGVALYFFLTDLYEDLRASKREKRMSNKNMDLDSIFDLYAQKSEEKLSMADVVQRFHDHATFLLSQMRKPREPIQWSSTMVYRYLMQKFPEVYERYSKSAGEGTPQPKSKSIIDESKHNRPLKQIIAADPRVKNRASSLSERQKTVVNAILQTIDELQSSGRFRGKGLSLRGLCKALVQRFEVVDEEFACELIRYYGSDILIAFTLADVHTRIRDDVEALSEQSSRVSTSIQKEARWLVLKPRDHVTTSMHRGDDSDSILQARNSHFGTRRSTSNPDGLQKTLNTAVKADGESDEPSRKKGMSTREPSLRRIKTNENENGSSKPEMDQDSDVQATVNDTEEPVTPPRQRGRRGRPSRSGKAAALRLAGTPLIKNRMSPSSSDSETTDVRLRKRRKLSDSPSSDTEADAGVPQPQDEEEELVDAGVVEEDIKTELMITSDPVLADAPQQPNGVWKCQHEGCDYTVEKANGRQGKAKIHAHFLEHADEIAARENLVLQESRPHLPISNLLEKLRSLGEAARLGERVEIGGRVVPLPIKRQMIA